MFSYNHKKKQEMFQVLDKYHQILFKKNMKSTGTSQFFLTRVNFFGHIIIETTIRSLKSRIDAFLKFQPSTKKKKIQEYLGMLTCLSKNVYRRQLYFRAVYKILRQQNIFE